MGTRRTGGAIAPTDSSYRFVKGTRATLLILAALLAALLLLALAMLRPAAAQGVLADGDAAVTAFSGALPPPLIAPGQDPAQFTVIDPAGATLRVVQLQAPGGVPQGQVAQAPKGVAITAAQIGQVFAVALDNASPPNIYVAATSAYGLPIVGANGQRLTQGAPGAQFMPGLFGPQGGPGSVWRIDGQSGEARLFTNITFENAPNGGAALGGLAFDNASRTLYVADRATGMIHALDPNGVERGRYDHGFTGREAGGLPQVQFDPSLRADITNPQFQPLVPATWGYTPPSRRVFGLAVRESRLYYAVAEGMQVWSVSLTPDGGFGTDARVEVAVAPGQGPSEISKIAFDDQGRMLLAERVAPSGAVDFAALTSAGGRVLRYTRGATGWTSDEFALGFGAGNRGGNGGVALGYGYANGQLDRNACGGFVWMSGEQLRVAADAALAGQLAQGGAVNVNGLQGSAADAVRPANTPPLQSYFVDLDDRFEDANARGQVGDVAIRRDCAPGGPGAAPAPGVAGPPPGAPGDVAMPYPPPPGEGGWFEPPGFWPDDWGPPPPPPACPVGTHVEKGLRCCPVNQIPGPFGDCGSPCANGSTAPADMLACMRGFQPPGPGGPSAGTCWNGTVPVSLCAGNNLACKKCPKSPLKVCPAGFEEVVASPANVPNPGWWWSDRTCRPTATQLTCGAWQQVGLDGVCQNLCPAGQWSMPVNRCCANGTAPNAQGQCGPGFIAPPQWYLDFLATGTGPCIPPNCSFYEFTITGKQRFGRGSLTQRVTLPPLAQMTGRVTKGGRYCPPSAWSCSQSGNTLTCSAENCGLSPGEQVVLRLEGQAAPELKEPPPQPTERTACATLTWQAQAGPGAATTVEQNVFERLRTTRAQIARTPQQAPPAGTPTDAATTTQEACWSILIPARVAETCPPNYVRLGAGQCCLASQVAGQQCCPPGQKPDPRRQTCVPVTPPTVVIPPVVIPPVVTPPVVTVDCPRGQYWDGQRCVRRCPPGTHREGRRCVPDAVCPPRTHMERGKCVPDRVCPTGHHFERGRCVPDVITCPAGQHFEYGKCVPDIIRCPAGMHREGRRCVPDVVSCPTGTHRVGRHCVPDIIVCPQGTRRVGNRCLPIAVICGPNQRRVGNRCVPIVTQPTVTPQKLRPIRPIRPIRPGPN